MEKKINCIFTGCFLYPYGYAATIRKQQFLEYLHKRGCNVHVLLTLKWAKGSIMNPNKGVFNGVPFETVGHYVKKGPLLPLTYIFMIVHVCLRFLFLKKKASKNMIVSFGAGPDTLVPLLFAKLIGYKIVFDIVEDFATLIDNNTPFLRRIYIYLKFIFPRRIICPLVDGYSTISHRIQRSIELRNIEKPIVLIPVSAENLKMKMPPKNQNDYVIFMYAGTFGEKEGLELLFETFNKINEVYTNTKLILTGNCPPDRMKHLLSYINNIESVNFKGRLDFYDYFHALYNADVLLMIRNNSLFANTGFPFKLGEYLATGNVVISTRVSDVKYYLENRKNAILVDPENQEQLYNAMKYCITNKEDAYRIGQEGIKVCQKYFNPDINSEKFYQLLRRV